MFGVFGVIALIGFWVGIVFLWIEDGPRKPLIFILLWLLGFLVLKFGALFMAYQAILAIVIFIIWKYKSTLKGF